MDESHDLADMIDVTIEYLTNKEQESKDNAEKDKQDNSDPKTQPDIVKAETSTLKIDNSEPKAQPDIVKAETSTLEIVVNDPTQPHGVKKVPFDAIPILPHAEWKSLPLHELNTYSIVLKLKANKSFDPDDVFSLKLCRLIANKRRKFNRKHTLSPEEPLPDGVYNTCYEIAKNSIANEVRKLKNIQRYRKTNNDNSDPKTQTDIVKAETSTLKIDNSEPKTQPDIVKAETSTLEIDNSEPKTQPDIVKAETSTLEIDNSEPKTQPDIVKAETSTLEIVVKDPTQPHGVKKVPFDAIPILPHAEWKSLPFHELNTYSIVLKLKANKSLDPDDVFSLKLCRLLANKRRRFNKKHTLSPEEPLPDGVYNTCYEIAKNSLANEVGKLKNKQLYRKTNNAANTKTQQTNPKSIPVQKPAPNVVQQNTKSKQGKVQIISNQLVSTPIPTLGNRVPTLPPGPNIPTIYPNGPNIRNPMINQRFMVNNPNAMGVNLNLFGQNANIGFNRPNFIANNPNFRPNIPNHPNFMANNPNFRPYNPNHPNFMANDPNLMFNIPNLRNTSNLTTINLNNEVKAGQIAQQAPAPNNATKPAPSLNNEVKAGQIAQQAPAPNNATKPAPSTKFDRKPNQLQHPAYPHMVLRAPSGIPLSFIRENPERYMNMAIADHITKESQVPSYGQGRLSESTVSPIQIELPNEPESKEQYSPSKAYDDGHENKEQELEDTSEGQSGQKRLSAFQRLGPAAPAAKKPRLTINLLFSKEQAVREVVDEQQVPANVPVHERKEMVESKNSIVQRYLPSWPWKMNMIIKKSCMPRPSKTVMLLEQDQVSAAYSSNKLFIKLSVKDYPRHFKKEDLLDLMMDAIGDIAFLPCFIEFDQEECKFLVLRSRLSLIQLHKIGLKIVKDDVTMPITISTLDLSLSDLPFVPRSILQTVLTEKYSQEYNSLNLKAFCLDEDISHFIYFPLNRQANQEDIITTSSNINWRELVELDLSHNRITSLQRFHLSENTPKLKHLNLSHNNIENMAEIFKCRGLLLRSINLDGNPLCRNYVDPNYYTTILKMLFPTLVEIDGTKVLRKGELPSMRANYCPSDATGLITKFVDTYFTLLEAPAEQRVKIRDLYWEKSCLTVTHYWKIRYAPIFRRNVNLFAKCRVLEDDNLISIDGATNITKHLAKWPNVIHDLDNLVIDVLLHNDFDTIFKISGYLKIKDPAAEEDYLLSFSKSIVLRSKDSVNYKIQNELLYWDLVPKDLASKLFVVERAPAKIEPTLTHDSILDDSMKKQLVEIFIKVTELDRKLSEKCLEQKNWDLKAALVHFVMLTKLNSVSSLKDAINQTSAIIEQ